jgi:hypothetical protein
MADADPLDLIEIACFECRKAFDVCIHDYRGRRCRELGYRSCEREAGRRYQGTPNDDAIVASMRKLLTAIYSVAKSRRPLFSRDAREA